MREKSVPFASLSLSDPRWLSAWAEERRQERLMGLFGPDGGPAAFLCGCDQVGTVKLLSRENGSPVKEMTYDSFGTLLSDSLPDLVFPLGFAGGLADRDTGLVRFDYRDYDPAVGLFTAPDPAGDRRGDGDMYDYCVDDPVSCVDPSGLAWQEADQTESDASGVLDDRMMADIRAISEQLTKSAFKEEEAQARRSGEAAKGAGWDPSIIVDKKSQELLDAALKIGEIGGNAFCRSSPIMETALRVTGVKAINNIQQAAKIADWLDYKLRGTTDNKASKALEQGWPKIRNGILNLGDSIEADFEKYKSRKK